MNISVQGVFWSFVIVSLTLLGIVTLGAGRQEAQLNRLLDNSAALYETACTLDNATLARVIKMGNDQGFYGSFLEVYNVEAPVGGNPSLVANPQVYDTKTSAWRSVGYRDRLYIELRYPTIGAWARVTQMTGLRGSMPKSEKKVAFKYVVCQKPAW